jgi:hypothetical protein
VGHTRLHERDEREVREYEARRHGRLTRAAWLVVAAVVVLVYLVVAGLRGSHSDDADATALEATASAAEHQQQAIQASAVVPAAAPADPSVLQITLSAHAPCWVSATVDGRRSVERLLEPGEEASLHVVDEVVLTAGDAAALDVTINGAPVRVLGRAGQVVTVRIDPDNYRSFLRD